MQIGIFAKTFARPTLAETLDAVAARGIQCVQFNMACAGVPSLPDQIEGAGGDDPARRLPVALRWPLFRHLQRHSPT